MLANEPIPDEENEEEEDSGATTTSVVKSLTVLKAITTPKIAAQNVTTDMNFHLDKSLPTIASRSASFNNFFFCPSIFFNRSIGVTPLLRFKISLSRLSFQ